MDSRFKKLRLAVVKVTNRCNIRCKYCYENIVAKGSDMSSEVFQRMIRTMLSSTEVDRFLVVLHGGEPTILPEAWFEENLSQVRNLAALYGKSVDISVQSNLIDVSDEKLRIFHQYNVNMGGSLDNPSTLKESHRPLAHKALATFLRARELGIRVGIISTINNSNIHSMREFCGWLHNTLGIKHFKANVAYSVGAGVNLPIPSAEDVFIAQRSIIEFMLETNGAFLEDNLCQEIVRFFENHLSGKDRHGTLCDDQRCGAGSRVVGVAPDGSLLPCGRFAWSDSHHYLGNFDNYTDQAALEYDQRVNQFHDLNPENWRECAKCEAASICNFGCQAFIVRSRSHLNIECEPTKQRFAYYSKNIDKLQGLYEKFCQFENRPSMTRLSQKLSKLRSLVPIEYQRSVQEQLSEQLEQYLLKQS